MYLTDISLSLGFDSDDSYSCFLYIQMQEDRENEVEPDTCLKRRNLLDLYPCKKSHAIGFIKIFKIGSPHAQTHTNTKLRTVLHVRDLLSYGIIKFWILIFRFYDKSFLLQLKQDQSLRTKASSVVRFLKINVLKNEFHDRKRFRRSLCGRKWAG